MGISRILYNIGLGAYHMGIKLSSPFNDKARKWMEGRYDWQTIVKVFLNDKPAIWVHCASLGEYEQGKPVIDAIEAQYPAAQVIVSFYSPSGYEVVKRREPQRAIVYLPPDSDANARAFLGLLKPRLAIFIKYEFWYHYLRQLRLHKVPTLLVSGIFRESQPFFRFYGGLHREMLQTFEHLFVQDNDSQKLLADIGFKNVTVGGDTRFDRVGAILAHPHELPPIASFKGDFPIFIAGSTWPVDEDLLLPLLPSMIKRGWKIIIAPHDIHTQHIQKLLQSLGRDAVLYSALANTGDENHNVLIIDSVGLLAHIYKYAEIAYVGGGFGKGIHNVLEPAASGLPVVFGPNYDKFKEATDLVYMGGALSVKSSTMLQEALRKLFVEEHWIKASSGALEYVRTNKGATAKIMSYISAQKLL
ncbi:glycosyltransferase N-terminal domain-containing protein [soil metagenome]